ncbi:translation elongation factor aEF-1 beta [Thermoplasmatales archaeon SCGC AB-540-F20]|nr:translation elongation factor aEF-1 beta [Thermoplasmatales archaeon SCGC AB-540-F20]
MGEVIALIRLMPDGVLSDDEIQTIIDEVRNVIKEPVKLGRVEVKNIAFGLRGLNVTVSVPDSEGGLDPVVEVFLKIDKIENVEVVDIGRI